MSGRPIIGFAHRGMRGQAPDNSVAGYRLALAAGARALEGDVWPSADGLAVLDHDGTVGGGPRRRPIPETARSELGGLDSLDDLYRQCGADFELSLDIKHPDALAPVLSAAHQAGATARLWLCHPDWRLVTTWRESAGPARLVDSTRLKKMDEGPARRVNELAAAGIDALNLPYPDWSAELVGLCRDAGIKALAWHAHTRPLLEDMVALGVDGVFSDDVVAMVDVLTAAGRLA
ncbi:MAG TPA: glycerophosphodiester phosphodiesterase [Acidimicrobiales bacterium]|nr:glycerophosphodiester phosphodiesterase [Acidimicrobiales bacterium]